ncbi:TetR/AcrR family transcriptional regulator [Nocardia sp. NPDC050710]|uniref:TetR/AcrR family transcriptional regulator n=1 Tax=Nocardia sp. NPDC050710 TaxID=3157220 RepID=UPI0033FB4CF2
MARQRDTRSRMVHSAVEVLRERGVGGVTIDAVLARSGAPRGSVYHHFPGGRAEIVSEALKFAGDAIGEIVDRGAVDGYSEALRQFVDLWRNILEGSDYSAGCPVVAVAVGPVEESPELFADAASIFERWRTTLATGIAREGLSSTTAQHLATMSIAAVEGAVILCRAQRSSEPLDEVVQQLEVLFDSQRLLARMTR